MREPSVHHAWSAAAPAHSRKRLGERFDETRHDGSARHHRDVRVARGVRRRARGSARGRRGRSSAPRCDARADSGRRVVLVGADRADRDVRGAERVARAKPRRARRRARPPHRGRGASRAGAPPGSKRAAAAQTALPSEPAAPSTRSDGAPGSFTPRGRPSRRSPPPRRRAVVLADPALPAEEEEHRAGDGDHDHPDRGVGPALAELRHVVEVHSVHADEEGQGDEDRRDDGQHLHHLVHPVGEAREVDLHQADRDLAVGLEHLVDLDGVIVRVAEVEAHLGTDPRALPACERRQRVAVLAHRPREPEDQAARGMDLRHRAPARVVDGLVLDHLHRFAERLDDRVVAVDQRVDQRIGEVVGGHRADQRAAADPGAHRVEDVLALLFEADHEVRADDEAHLLELALRVAVEARHPGDHEVVALVRLHLRPLRHVHHVRERERVDPEDLADPPQTGLVAEAVHLDPLHAGRAAHRRELLDVGHVALDEVSARPVLHHVDLARSRLRRERQVSGTRADRGPAPVEREALDHRSSGCPPILQRPRRELDGRRLDAPVHHEDFPVTQSEAGEAR